MRHKRSGTFSTFLPLFKEFSVTEIWGVGKAVADIAAWNADAKLPIGLIARDADLEKGPAIARTEIT